MTLALAGYSGVFMRYALAVTPKNYLLFGCHVVNFSAQLTQGYRYINHWHMGGKEKSLEAKAKEGLGEAKGAASNIEAEAKGAATKIQEGAKNLADEAKQQVEKVTR